ncbi:MAG: methyltransferase [Vicinamibacteria bacterium]|nr:methyltransferase [Vicinamibacteria bacterium]
MKPVAASFRDPETRVLEDAGGRVLRALSPAAAVRDQRFRDSGLVERLVRQGLLVDSWRVADPVPAGDWAAMLEARRVPFVSYPYEWSFSMLQDAAALTLQLCRMLLAEGAILRDASAYNVLFDGAAPVFVDLGSLGEYAPGMPWEAYGQFCDHFLAPLMLEAYKGLPFQPFLRGNLEGLPIARTLAPMLGPLAVVKPGVLSHVKLRSWLESRSRTLSTTSRREVRKLQLPKAAVEANLAGLLRLVGRLRSRASSDWAAYDADGAVQGTADAAYLPAKEAFVERAAAAMAEGALAFDLGANTGRFSRILARRAGLVVAMDADAGAVDALYRALRTTPERGRVLPLVADLMNPSPDQGWRGHERTSLFGRGRPALATCLALVHHLCLGRNVPIPALLDWLADVADVVVVEFVAAEDPMAQSILATHTGSHPGYDRATFRALAAARAEILDEEEIAPTRTLYRLAFRHAAAAGR